MSTPKHVVSFSGGVGSWAAAKRVVQTHGREGVILLFAQVYIEDDDLYRFLIEAGADVMGVPIPEGLLPLNLPPTSQVDARKAVLDSIQWPGVTVIAQGDTPWEVFEKERYIGNSRVDPCSRVLKREMLDRWRDKNCEPWYTTIHVGIDWTEKHRLDKLRTYVHPWGYQAPLISPPYRTKQEMLEDLTAAGIETPLLYRLGFSHNNCGGFCVKAGHSHFRHLLTALPGKYAEHEAHEARLIALGINGTILRDRSGGTTTPMTLREFRERTQSGSIEQTNDDLAAGCGCAL